MNQSEWSTVRRLLSSQWYQTGLPAFPIIFVLVLEPFLRRLRDNSDVNGITIKHKHCKVVAYADNILLFLTDPITTIHNLLKEFKLFNRLSNLQINFTKSTALNISLPSSTVSLCQQNFPFRWESNAVTYLGIKLPTVLNDLYAKDFLPILQTIRDDLHNWNKGRFLWFGRAAILKMNVLPWILYLMQAIPIKLPPTFFTSFKHICRTFLWTGHPPPD